MTVTESGYYINEDNNLNLNLQIVKDNISQKENYSAWHVLPQLPTVAIAKL